MVQIFPNVKQFGSQSYKFGFDDPEAEAIADSVGLMPQTLDVQGEPEFTSDAQNLSGMTEARVIGDQKYTFTMSGFVVDRSKLELNGATFNFGGRMYIVESTKFTISNTEFQKGEVTGSSHALITA